MNTLTLIIASLIPLLAPEISEHKKVPLTLEYADTPEKKEWGLMGRKELPPDHGMLFINDEPSIQSLWMFNCFMDLSVAFIADDGTIREIKEMKSYPEKMDQKRKVQMLSDLDVYPLNDPIIQFFQSKITTSSEPVRYSLEMDKGWFAKHGIKAGDQLIWKVPDPKAYIIKKP